MSRKIALTVCLLLTVALATKVSAQDLKREILGLSLAMTREQAHVRLKEIGTFERDERKQQEIWRVRDATFSHLIIGCDKEGKLRFITAVAREDKDAKRMPYGEIGDLKKARQAGDEKINNFHYQWDLSAEKDHPPMMVSVRGRDPKFLSIYSLKRLGDDAADAKP